MIPETRYAMAPDGVYVAYQVIGDGPPDLVWFDGARGNLEVMWEQPLVAELFMKLAARCRVVRLDMRGTGLSDRGDRPPNLETQMEDARVVLDVIGSHRTAVVGHNWGCAAASLFAGTFPKRTTALVLAAAQARNAWAEHYPWGFKSDQFDRSLQMIATGWGTEGYAAMNVSYSAPSLVGDRDYVRWEAKMQRHWVGPTTAADLERQYFESDVHEVLRSLQVPTLVVAREWANPEEDEYIADLIPDARLVRLPGTDWMMWAGEQDPVVNAFHSFLEGRSEAIGSDTVLATVLFTDIVASTGLAAEMGDRVWRELVERHHSIVRGLLRTFRGVEVDTAGDGFFATFDGPARAIRCAREIVEAVRSIGIEVRAGLHTGECETIDEKVGGIAVNIGARVMGIAGPSQVVVSQTVKDLVAGSALAFENIGPHALKGLSEPWTLYRVVP